MKTRILLTVLFVALGSYCVKPLPPPPPPKVMPPDAVFLWILEVTPKTDCESMAITNSNWQRCPEKL